MKGKSSVPSIEQGEFKQSLATSQINTEVSKGHHTAFNQTHEAQKGATTKEISAFIEA